LSKNQEKKKGWDTSDKALGIIAIILVGGYFLFMAGVFDDLQFDAWKTQIDMTKKPVPKQCDDLRRDYRIFKEYLGVGDILTEEQIDAISYTDYLYLTELELEADTINCSLNPDT
jgi:hypothetical protein